MLLAQDLSAAQLWEQNGWIILVAEVLVWFFSVSLLYAFMQMGLPSNIMLLPVSLGVLSLLHMHSEY